MKPTTQLIQELRDEATYRVATYGCFIALLDEAADRLEKLLGMVQQGNIYEVDV